MIKPLWSAKRAFELTWEHKRSAFKIGLGYTVILVAIFSIEGNLTKGNIGLTIGKFIVEAFLAFMWHRVVLLNNDNYSWFGIDESVEKTDMEHVNDGMTKFMWTSVGFVIVGGLVFLIILFVSHIVSIVSSMVSGNDIEAVTAMLGMIVEGVVLLLIMTIILRLALVFPAIAIGHSTSTLRAAWGATKGQSLRIIGSYMGVASVWAVMLIGLSSLSSLFSNLLGEGIYSSIAVNIITAIFVVYFTMIWAGLNSTLFMQLHDDIDD